MTPALVTMSGRRWSKVVSKTTWCTRQGHSWCRCSIQVRGREGRHCMLPVYVCRLTWRMALGLQA